MKSKYVLCICSLLLVLLLSALSGSRPAIAADGALDGKTFAGDMGEKGKAKGDKDELVFKDGKFHSVACEKYGFGDAAYTATVNGGTTAFEAVTTSTKEGKMKWSGTVVGDKLDGTATWYKDGQAPIEYWFTTQLKM